MFSGPPDSFCLVILRIRVVYTETVIDGHFGGWETVEKIVGSVKIFDATPHLATVARN